MRSHLARSLTAIALFAPLVAATGAAARPGDLDGAFSKGGRLLLPVGAAAASQTAVAVTTTPGGGILVLGSASRDRFGALTVARYTSTGSLDPSFGSQGAAYVPMGRVDAIPRGIALTADGKIVIGGTASDGARRQFAIARLTSSGALDTSFGSGGRALFALGSGDAVLGDIALDASGRVVAAGTANDVFGRNVFATVRLTTAGGFDGSFGGGVAYALPGGLGATASSVSIAPSGKIVVGGFAKQGSRLGATLVVYTPAGVRDTGFSGDGQLVTPVTGANVEIRDLAVQTDGRIIVAADRLGGPNDVLVGRYTTAGAFDTTWNAGSFRRIVFGAGGPSRVTSVRELLSGGAIVGHLVAGYLDRAADRIGYARVNANGTAITYARNDAVPGASSAAANGAAVRSGKIVLAGRAQIGTVVRFALARYGVTAGALDATFAGGHVVTQLGDNFLHSGTGPSAILPYSNGKLGIVGRASSAGVGGLLAGRLADNGTFDTTFGGDGISLLAGNAVGRGVIGPGGRVIIAGGDGGQFFATAFTPLGAIDRSFGSRGVVRATVGTAVASAPGAIGIAGRAGGGSILVGPARVGTATRIGVAALTVAGKLDASFAGGAPTYLIGSASTPTNVVVQPNGRIVVGANVTAAGGPQLALLGLRANGTVDTGFGSGGTVLVPLGPGGSLRDVSAFPDGRLVALARVVVNGRSQFRLVILTAAGTPDTRFGGGQVQLLLDGAFPERVAAGRDGRVTVAGDAGFYLLIARFGTTGALDPGFGVGGIVRMRATGAPQVTAFARAPDGRFVVGYNSADRVYQIARLLGDPPSSRTGAAGKGEAFVRVQGIGSAAFAQGATIRVQFGRTRGYGRLSSPAALPADGKLHAVTLVVKGLRPKKTYHYRVVVRNGSGVAYGADHVFATGISTPRVSLTRPRVLRVGAWRTLHGRAADPAPSSGIAQVLVSVVRIRSNGTCFAYTRVGFRVFGCAKARRVFVRAKIRGTAWTLPLRGLRAGRYTIRMRSVDGAGLTQRAFIDGRNRFVVTLR